VETPCFTLILSSLISLKLEFVSIWLLKYSRLEMGLIMLGNFDTDSNGLHLKQSGSMIIRVLLFAILLWWAKTFFHSIFTLI